MRKALVMFEVTMFARMLCCLVFLSVFTLVAARTATSQVLLNPVVAPTDPAKLHPVERVPRERFGLVGAFPLDENDLRSLVYPSATADERAVVLEGLTFFTTPHTEPDGLGPSANQRFCLGCHTNSADVLNRDRNVQLTPTASPASRAARSSTTNFSFTAFDAATGGGRAPDNVDAINNTGKTAAFTLFGDFNPATNAFNALGNFSAGGVQRVRPALDACLPDRIPLLTEDPNIPSHMPGVDATTGFRRTTGERAAPPYIGRGLMEAVFDGDIVANATAEQGDPDGLAGRANMNTSNQAFCGGHTDVRVGRLGLRAGGPTLTQFMIGGSQGELGVTSPLFPTEPQSFLNVGRAGCANTQPTPLSPLLPLATACTMTVGSPTAAPGATFVPEIPLSTIISLRALIRLIAPPEFG